MEGFRDQLRLSTLQCVDPYALHVVAVASSTALYNYDEAGETWNKTNIEGTLMLYTREVKPFHMITIINRNSKCNFNEPITKNCDAQIKTPYILLRNDQMKILGVWFAEESDVPKIFQTIGNFIKSEEQETPPTLPASNAVKEHLPSKATDHTQNNFVTSSSSPENIMSMLSKAHGEYEIKKVDNTAEKKATSSNSAGQGNNSSSLILNLTNSNTFITENPAALPPQGTTVADFFAKVGVGLASSVSVQHVSPQNKINGNANVLSNNLSSTSTNPVLQQLFQNAAAMGGQASVLDNKGANRALSIPGSGAAAVADNRDTNLSKSGSMSLQELEGQLRKNLQVSAFPLTSEEDTSKRVAVGDQGAGIVKSPLLPQTFALANMTTSDKALPAVASLESIESKAAIGSSNTHVLCSPPGLNTSGQCSSGDISHISLHDNVNLTEEDVLNKNEQDQLRLFQLQHQVQMQHLLKQQQLRVQQKQQQHPLQQQQQQQQLRLLEQQQQQQQQKPQPVPANTDAKKVLTPLSQSQFVMAMSHALTKEEFVQQLYQAYEEAVLKYNC